MRRFAKTVLLTSVMLLVSISSVRAQAQTFKILHDFTGGDGGEPYAGLTIDANGNFYGTTTEGGGASYGTVFKLTNKNSSWILSRLYSFAGGSDGSVPQARVMFGPNGSLYGTTTTGGQGTCIELNGGCGTVFNVRPSARAPASVLAPWNETLLYAFLGGCCDGAIPRYGDLIFDEAGNLYGTTSGCDNSCGNAGTVYELTPSNGGWMENVLYSFTEGNDGASPYGGVIFDKAGNLYGTTAGGGPYGPYGLVFQLKPSASGWTENVLHAFNGDDGADP